MSKIFVIGDHIIDRYIYGDVTRVSPEAPIPVFNVDKTKEPEQRIGGAGNVAMNMQSLGGDFTYWTDNGKIPVKTRLIARGQQVLRMDEEDTSPHVYTRREFLEIEADAREADVIAIQDYGKGVITKELMDHLWAYRHKMIIDPYPRNTHLYRETNIIMPNEHELTQMANESDLDKAGRKLSNDLEVLVLATRGENGMSLFIPKGKFQREGHYDYQTTPVQMIDVTGAGDTALAALCVYLSEKRELRDAIKFANKAAGISVQHRGTYQVRRDEVEKV